MGQSFCLSRHNPVIIGKLVSSRCRRSRTDSVKDELKTETAATTPIPTPTPTSSTGLRHRCPAFSHLEIEQPGFHPARTKESGIFSKIRPDRSGGSFL